MSSEDSSKLAAVINNYRPENAIETMEAMFGRPKYAIEEIGILVYDGVNDLDVIGPRYILGQAMGVRIRLVGLHSGVFTTVMGVQMMAETSIDSVQSLDILVIPGGFTATLEAAHNKKLLNWIRRIDKTTKFTASVCTGAWILGATGALENKRASSNWFKEKEFLTKYGAIPANERFTRDGKYWTSAGVTAGMDMSLAMMNAIYGDLYTQAIMLDLEYDPMPSIVGGTPEKTNWAVNWMMTKMYEEGLSSTQKQFDSTDFILKNSK